MNFLKTKKNYQNKTYNASLRILSIIVLFFFSNFINVTFGNDLIENTQLGLPIKSSGLINKIAKEIASQREASSTELKPFKISNLLNSGSASYVEGEVYLGINKEEVKEIFERKKDYIILDIPVSKTKSFQVELVKTNIFSDNFLSRSSGGETFYKKDIETVFYRGIVKNDENSIVAITVFEDNVEGLIADDFGNYVIGRMDQSPSDYILYNERKLRVLNNFRCGVTDEMEGKVDKQVNNTKRKTGAGGGSVGVYIEADYQMYKDNGRSRSNVQNYVYNLFNQVKTIYANEGIDVHISELYVWEESDLYAHRNSSLGMLDEFRDVLNETSFNGHLAHLISTRRYNSGWAWEDEICGDKPYAVSTELSTNVVPFPTYSWDVMLFAHEMGHNFGSPHTHSCAWNGNDTQIDDCGGEAGYGEYCYDSTEPIVPANGGTIMSYCYLNPVGTNFNLGFGQQPGDLIRDRYNNAACTCPSDLQTDIFITEQTVSNNNPSVGDEITISFNQHVANATVDYLSPQPVAKFYLSDDLILDDEDIFLTQENSTIGISDEFDFEERNITVDSDWGSGTKYILFVADANQEHAESNEDNNLEYVEINIGGNGSSLPDIFITQQTVSNNNPNVGDEITVSLNQHVANATDSYLRPYPVVKFYLSDDLILDEEDIFLKQENSTIGTSDGFDFEETNITVESDWGSDTKYILFVADANLEHTESNENNNVEYVEINIGEDISGGNLPDLFITGQAVSNSNPSVGDEITVSLNQHVANATDSYLRPYPVVKFYLSDDLILDEDDIFLKQENSTIGISDEFDFEESDITVESDWGSGIKYILFVADADLEHKESNEDNNIEYIEINIGDGGDNLPDIFITQQAVSNTSPSVGDEINVSLNQHVANATDSYLRPYPVVKFYLSDDLNLDENDIFLKQENSTIGTSDEFDFEESDITVESDWGSGTKYILFVADADLEHAESNEDNNIEYIEINIGGGGGNLPDIFITQQAVSNTNPSVGEEITISLNQHVANATVSYLSPRPVVKFYLSGDLNLDNDDIFLKQESSTIGTSDEFDYEERDVTVQNDWGSGTKYILFVADADLEHAESNEDNNVEYVEINIGGSGENLPDIFLTQQAVSNTNPNVGEEITISYNQHVANATVNYLSPHPVAKFYLSDDLNLDEEDVFLKEEISTIGTSDEFDYEERDITVESDWGSGTKYILFVADADLEHAESNEDNNVEYVEINIGGGGDNLPDIFLTQQAVSNTNPSLGDEVIISCNQHVVNATVNSLSPFPVVKFYLSDDLNLDDDDVFLRQEYSTIGASDEYDYEERDITVDSDWGSGTKYILFVADANQKHRESNEDNNIEYLQINVGGNNFRTYNPLSISNSCLTTCAQYWSIAPNPVTVGQNIAVNLYSNKVKEIKVYGLDGNLKINELVTKGQESAIIESDNLKTGIYLISIIDNTGQLLSTEKIIVK